MILFPSKFIVNIPWKRLSFKLPKTKFYFQKWEDYSTLAWTTSVCYTVQTIGGLKESLKVFHWLYQWMQLSVACLVPYFSVLFHSYSLLSIAVAHQTLTELHQPCSSNSIAVAHQTLTELHLTVHQPCSSNSKPMQDGTHKHQTVLLASMLPGCRNSQMCQNFVHVWL